MIGILGGTFDPIHLGHLRMAMDICELNQLEEIRFIPCKKPVLKNDAIANSTHRLAMLKLATANEPRFMVDESELNRPSASYTIETLKHLKQIYPDKTLGLIIGSDSLIEFTRWKNYEEIIKLSKLLVVPRASYPLEIPKPLKPSISIQNITTLPISSTQIRSAIQANKSARYFVPDQVWDYICAHQLYR